jgi:hypothetical protein
MASFNGSEHGCVRDGEAHTNMEKKHNWYDLAVAHLGENMDVMLLESVGDVTTGDICIGLWALCMGLKEDMETLKKSNEEIKSELLLLRGAATAKPDQQQIETVGPITDEDIPF